MYILSVPDPAQDWCDCGRELEYNLQRGRERIDSTDSDKSQSGGKHHVNIYLQYIQQTY